MRSPVHVIEEGMNIKKHKNMKIGVGYIVKAKVGELENITREERIRRTRKEVVVCVQDVAGNKKFLVQFEYFQKKEIIYSSLVFLISKEEVDMDEPLSHSPEKEQGGFLTIFVLVFFMFH